MPAVPSFHSNAPVAALWEARWRCGDGQRSSCPCLPAGLDTWVGLPWTYRHTDAHTQSPTDPSHPIGLFNQSTGRAPSTIVGQPPQPTRTLLASMAASASTATDMGGQEGNEQVKQHYDQLLGRTYTWCVRACVWRERWRGLRVDVRGCLKLSGPNQSTNHASPTPTPRRTRRMMGGAAPNWEENESFFRLHGLGPAAQQGSDKALDLGCGCVRLRARALAL